MKTVTWFSLLAFCFGFNVMAAQDLPPQPIDATPHFSYWQSVWDAGTPTDKAFLQGSWRVIAEVSTKRCGMFSDRYDEDGLRNDDRSYFQLAFSDFRSGHPNSGETTFGVRLLNMGEKNFNQGPFVVDANEPQFAQWAFQGGEITHQAYFNYSCRATPDPYLICAIRSHIGRHGNSICDRDPYAMVYVFKKLGASE